MLNGMDVELDMEMETDCIIYTIPKKLYKKLYEENGAVKDYTMEMVSEKFSDIMWLFNQFVFSNVASRLAGVLLEHRAMEGQDVLPVTTRSPGKGRGDGTGGCQQALKQFQADGMVRLTRGRVEIVDAEDWGKSENISEHRVEDKQMVKAAFFDIDGTLISMRQGECRKARGWRWKR